jgi:hypothetical protein
MIKGFTMSSFVAGFMLGAASIGAWFVGSNSPLTPFLSPASSVAVKKTLPESGAISVANQPAGTEVIIESVTVSPPGVWVAVREVNGNDLGNVLGAVRVNGPLTNVSVPLLRSTEPDLSYAVELYRDDSNGAFDLTTDSVYVDFNTGAPVVARFTTTN